MKRILTTLFVAFTILAYGQNYQPFSETSSKRFFATNDPTDNDYFFHADSSMISGDSVIFHQYFTIQDTGTPGNNPSNCLFWGGTTVEELDTTWLGIDLIWDQVTQELHLKNALNETIVFDFGLALSSSQAFYANSSSIYSIEYTALNSEMFFGVTDNVKTFTVSVTDLGGTPVSSTLNNFEIKLSENYGLLSFIDTYNLPSTELGLELQGHTNPLLGTYQLTYDDCYPWNTNDVLQYYTYRSEGMNGPPSNISYQTLTVIDRIETADSVKLYFSSISQLAGSATSVPNYGMNYDPLFFKKGTPISEIPWNSNQDTMQLVRAEENEVDYCGFKPNFKTQSEFAVFCESCACFGAMDGFGQSTEKFEYVNGHGLYRKSFQGYGPLQSTPSGSATLTYSNIGGVECGTFWNDLDEINHFNLHLFPNPSNDVVNLQCDYPITAATLYDFSGRMILELSNLNKNDISISLDAFQKGAYIIEVKANDSVQKKTIFKQ